MENLFGEEEKRRLAALLPALVGTIIDVGAHTGEFALMAAEIFPNARMYCFEPLPTAFAVLEARMKDVPGYSGFPFALGACEEDVMMYCNAFTASSSLLPMTWNFARSLPYMALTRRIPVQMRRLDDVLSDQPLVRPVLLKMDVQGYEDRVLQGAERMLSSVDIIVTEVSFGHWFRGQLLAEDMKNLLKKSGFAFVGYSLEMRSYDERRVMLADAVFFQSRADSGVRERRVAESVHA